MRRNRFGHAGGRKRHAGESLVPIVCATEDFFAVALTAANVSPDFCLRLALLDLLPPDLRQDPRAERVGLA